MGKYAKEKWIEILREGVWNGLDYTPKFIDDIAESYDPELLKAPLTLGHPSFFDAVEKPAYGHVLELKVEEGSGDTDHYRLTAKVGFSAEAVEMVESGKYSERSIGWDASYPMMGIPYLTHLALLGANNPAAAGMDAMELSFKPLQIIDDDEFDSLDDTSGKLSRPVNLIWDVTGEKIRYRVRPPSRFRDDTFVTKWFNEKEGINAVMGKLKDKYVPKGGDADSLVIQNIMFDKGKEWDLAKAKVWIKEHKGTLSKSNDIDTDSDEESVEDKIKDDNKIKDGDTQMSGTDADEKAVPEPASTPAVTPPLPAEQILIEPKSARDLQNKNLQLQKELDEANAELLSKTQKLNRELNAEVDTLRRSRISTTLQSLQIEGYLTHSQMEMGLTEALAAIPADARVISPITDKKTLVTDVIIECLKVGGKLKLKGELYIPEILDTQYTDLELAAQSNKVKGINVASRMKDLMREGKTPEQAIIMAEHEAGGKR